MGAAEKTFYPGWHYPTLSEELIREHLIAPLQAHHAVMVENIVPGFVDRAKRRVVNPWTQRVVDELDATIVHDFASTKRGLDAGVRAGVFEIQSHGYTHMPPDLDSPPGPLWSAPPRSPLVQLSWYKEFGDTIRKAEIPASVQRVHLQRGIDALVEDFGVPPLSLVAGGGLSSHSMANNTMRLAAKMGFGYAQPESAFYLGHDYCVVLEPISPRIQWQYDQPLTARNSVDDRRAALPGLPRSRRGDGSDERRAPARRARPAGALHDVCRVLRVPARRGLAGERG